MKFLFCALIAAALVGCKGPSPNGESVDRWGDAGIPPPPPNRSMEYWQARADQIKVGETSRREVEEELLPLWMPSGGDGTDYCQVDRYWVDEDTKVIVTYDHSGRPIDISDYLEFQKWAESTPKGAFNGTLFGNPRHPGNKVLRAPTLEDVPFEVTTSFP